MGWQGYEKARDTDEEGVIAVLKIADLIPATDGRRNMSPSIAHELAHIIERESRWSPSIENSIGAVGLIQFMPDTARTLGTTTGELKKMSRKEQAPYVLKYFRNVLNATGPIEKPGDMYMATFYPKYFRAPDDTIIGAKDSKGYAFRVWEQNPGLRCSPEGPITAGCVRAFGTPTTEPPSGWPTLQAPDPTVDRARGNAMVGLLLIVLVAYAFRRGVP